jgi:hypothetical protein
MGNMGFLTKTLGCAGLAATAVASRAQDGLASVTAKRKCPELIFVNHTVPESCADVREGIGEALTGVRIGWV